MIYFGGQLLKHHFRRPVKVNKCVYRPFNVNRLHAYAVRGRMLGALYQHLVTMNWCENFHVDHHIGLLHETSRYNIYTPAKWLVGQLADESDITYESTATRFWLHPDEAAMEADASLAVLIGEYYFESPLLRSALEKLGVKFDSQNVDRPGPVARSAGFFEKICSRYPILYMGGLCERPEIKAKLSNALGFAVWQAAKQGKIAGIDHPSACFFLPFIQGLIGRNLRVINFVADPHAVRFCEAGNGRDRTNPTIENSSVFDVRMRLKDSKTQALVSVPYLTVYEKELTKRPRAILTELIDFIGLAPSPEQFEQATALFSK